MATRAPKVRVEDAGGSKRRKRRALTQDELVSIIEDREQKADSARPDAEYYGDALGYYMGDDGEAPAPDRSSIVMLELLSTIEWIKPVLAKIFFGGPKVLQFSPTKRGDEKRAEQETDYVNHLITQRNDGFSVMMDWFTDAMLSKNAYVYAYWEEKDDTTETELPGVTEQQLAMIAAQPDKYEIKDLAEGPQVAMADGLVQLYTARVIERKKKGKVCMDNVPPERVRIDARHRKITLHDCPFVQFSVDKTISELREMGFDVPDDINDDDESSYGDQAAVDQFRRGTEHYLEDSDDGDPASREVCVRITWARVDWDGDGIAELRRIILVGKTILYNEPDDIVGLCCISPLRVPHRHLGMSLYDIVKQVQDFKTQLARGLIDNVYLANNGRWFLTKNVDLEDFYNTKPNSGVAVDAESVAGQAMPFQHPMLGAEIAQMLEYADSISENWTGVSPRSLQGQTFDGNSINKTASGLSQIMSAALGRIEMMARLFAETGVKELFLTIHALARVNATQEDTFELRGEWIDVDPMAWEERTAMTVDSGLGTGDRQQRISVLQQLIQSMVGMLNMGAPLTDWGRVYNAFVKLTHEMGYLDDTQFWVDPKQTQQQGGLESLPVDQRQMVMEQIQGMVEQQLKAREAEMKQQADARGIEADVAKAQMDNETKMQIANSQQFLDLVKTIMEQGHDAAMQGAEEGPPPTGTQKRVVHIYDEDGRIVESQLVEE